MSPKRAGGGGGTLVITGLKELDAALKALEPKIAKKVLRQAIRQGLKVVKAEVERRAPVGEHGAIRASVKLRARRGRGRIALMVTIGEGDFRGETYYAAFVEFGHKLGKGPAAVPPQPFMRPAFHAVGNQARDITVAAIRAGVDAIVRESRR